MFFDSHAHYDDEKFDADRDAVLSGLPAMGISCVLNAASSLESSKQCLDYALKYEHVYASAGVHPHEAASARDGFDAELEKFFQEDKVVAIGEIGLDYHYDFSPRETQRNVFVRQLELATKLKKPIIIHDREAHKDISDIIRAFAGGLNGGVFHCFSGGVEIAREVLGMGFYLSFGGAVTFKNARRAIEAIEYMPIDRLLLETDCPYMTHEPHRGKRNDSSMIPLVAKKIAEIKGITVDEVADITNKNAKKLFNIH